MRDGIVSKSLAAQDEYTNLNFYNDLQYQGLMKIDQTKSRIEKHYAARFTF